MSKKIIDKQRLDYLEKQNSKAKYTGRCIFRWSTTYRGWRLHETSEDGSSETVRLAIDKAIIEDKYV